MIQERGRTLLEMIGYLFIAGLMVSASIKTYSFIKTKQSRMIASYEIKKLIQDINTLYSFKESYEDLSLNYLVKSGALKTNKSFIGKNWIITGSQNSFIIKFTGLNKSDCNHFSSVLVGVSKIENNCNNKDNYIKLIVEK